MLVSRMVVPQHRANRDHRARQPQLRGPFHLTHSVLDIVHVDHGDALELARVGLAELGNVVVIGPKYRREDIAGGHPPQGQPLGRVQHAARYAIQRQVPNVGLGVQAA